MNGLPFMNHRDEQTDYDRVKIYTMTLEDGNYKISLIEYDEITRDVPSNHKGEY
ncbi:hypothetical protein SAMN04488072_10537 [Lentibacillus halodurans]|uniref:Uncharacterized protein n=1 Tax=Lentibacillus halodurans TaxID=237679 RepID=A0A1I0XHZ0_9BACI|nr:hypothetical protein [Lentibacillus halodurans]SFA99900.1 hypothetical protein SAMN04488072_10537 [Lentibacillus halodurans]